MKIKISNLNLILLGSLAALMTSCAGTGHEGEEAFQSTIFNPDGTVTFRYYNPEAKSVQVDVQFAGRNDMTLDSLTGIWSATLGPVAPDMYPYCFVVDGVGIMDPENMQYFPNEGFKNSLVDIPSPDPKSPLAHAITDVPHGNVDYIRYFSNAIGAYNNALVYTPATYQSDTTRRYPVFYLISGTTDTDEVYYKVGRANYILDNLIAQGKAKDMIVVMPYGNPGKLINAPMTFGPGGTTDFFSQDLLNDLMPYIEDNYRTINDAENRAIGGFSRGGNQALLNGLKNLDKFSYLCSYSSCTTTDLPQVYDNAQQTNDQINLFWSGVGTDDFLYGSARDYTEFLDSKGIRNIKFYTDDKFGHTWMNAKCFLTQTYPLLFNPDAAHEAMAQATPTKEKTGQEPQFTPGVMARLFPKPVISPQITTDSIIFRVKAENAHEVLLSGDFTKQPIAMSPDKDGVWSISIASLPNDVYLYHFIVDGVQMDDKQNMYLAPEKGFKRSILDNTTHTDVQYPASKVQYRVDNLKNHSQRKYAVITPATVENTPQAAKLPKITLTATGRNTWEGWHKIVKANQILDQMLASGNAQPVILVLADTNFDKAPVTINASEYKNWSEARQALINALSNTNNHE